MWILNQGVAYSAENVPCLVALWVINEEKRIGLPILKNPFEISKLVEKVLDIFLSFSSLRLLAPPIRLVSAAMWKVMKQRDVMHYGMLEEFVTSCCETVPGLLTSRHQAKLALGLRSRLILELCNGSDPPDPSVVLPQLERIRAPTPSSALKKDVKIETAVTNLRDLVESFLKDPTERELFYKVEFPSEYGPQFDQELEKLLWEFLLRLDQLLPVPNLAQTVSWLTAAPPVLEECAQAASQPQLLRTLLQHQICLGHLDSAASLPPCMGDYLLSSLSLPPSGRVQQSVQSRSKPASVSTPSPLSLTPLTDYRQTNLSSPVAPVIGGICNEDLPAMASANKRARTFQEDVIIQSVSRDVEQDAESTERSKYTWVKSREEESEEDEEIMVMRRGRKRRDRGSKRVLRRGRGGGGVRDGEKEDTTSGRDGETERDLLRDFLVQLGIANLKVPEDHRLYSYITSCLLNKPRVLIPRLTSTDITALMRSQPPSCSNGTPTAGEGSSPWGQNKRPKLPVITACRLPSTWQRKLSDRSLTLDMELPASADKENVNFSNNR
ncbi:uncharacterized protein LOC120030302 isoform X1 [Salvelinus namaycush]|uniref:Uncharacterized protein LOC120030302 isoform X1 n=2 Tax=Salvelinus namaycush TaxID=8040 RepID=A0A8U0PUU8_SALNM|nr:uncharacterized protein LOC120030302 isoform X1 [Salvelinus namaycush]